MCKVAFIYHLLFLFPFTVRHYLVKCPQNSSGETVTSVTSLAPLHPKKGKRRKEKADVPPAVPAKGRDPRGSHRDWLRSGPGV